MPHDPDLINKSSAISGERAGLGVVN